MKVIFNRDIIRGIFLLVLTILATTVENTFSCQTLQFIYKNTYARQFLLLSVIYFIIDFSTKKSLNPSYNLKYSLILYILYTIVSKQNIFFSSIIFILICIAFNYVRKTFYTK